MTAPLQGLDILVVEDHYFVATELERVLRELGAGVIGPVARLPPDGWFATKPISVALMDVKLDCGTSFRLIDEMAGRGIPVALITGYGPSALPLPYRGLPRLEKPVERGKLALAVLHLAGRTEGLAS